MTLKKSSFLGILLAIFCLNSCSDFNSESTDNQSSSDDYTHEIDSIISLMTLKEKIGQLVQYNGSWDLTGPPSDMGSQQKLEKIKKGEVGSMLNVLSVKATREAQKVAVEHSRLGIPLIFGYDVIHGYKTMFPIPLGEAASWDLKLMEESARISAVETAASGVHWTFAPMLDVSRDARWGRIMEGAGEDPYLTSQVGVAKIKGYQGNDLSNEFTIAACAKHFAGYGFGEAGRDYNTVNIGIRELQNSILPPFKAAADAEVATFMNAFNDIDGIPATGSKMLQREILKGNWNWDGFVVSDWGSISEMQEHGFAKDLNHAAEIAIHAGSDMDMESYAYEDHLESLIKNDKVDVAYIEDAVRRVLRIKFRLGLFDDPYKYCNEEREKENIYTDAHLESSRNIAKRSIVLLKNSNHLLPLKKEINGLAVIGPLGDDKDSPIGNWRAQGESNSAVSFLEGVENALNAKVPFQKGVELSIGKRNFLEASTFNTTDASGIPAAVDLAKKSKVVLLVVGEDAFQSGEGRSQASISLAGLQHQLIEEIYKVNKNIVLVLMNGRPLDLSLYVDRIPVILETWHLGSEAGNAIADVIFGDYNPSGKLPVSFPHAVGQEPFYYNQKNTGRPSNDSHVTYSHHNDVPKQALFPFGYGLSYTTFEYDNLKLSHDVFDSSSSISVSVDIKNTGDRAGEEVIQLYIRDMVGSITRPIKELKGFEKINIASGETQTVSFTIDEEMIEFYTVNNKWEAESGEFKVFVGSNSEDLLESTFTFKN
ncbi:MAG: glycosyl hydrolase [Bacteroidetes bacterium MedPE-SWsnd-G1]|nr:MAG: glycosyl hydrolase [Bacteroidetes bacterium MedPE-SWsnd-G1]